MVVLNCAENIIRNVASIGPQYLKSKAFSLESQKEKQNEVIDLLEGKISLPPDVRDLMYVLVSH